jgi:flagellar hook-associated protein FlgK
VIIDTINTICSENFRSKLILLNTHLQQVTQLNKQIFQSTAGGLDANDLMDQRDKIIGDCPNWLI